MWLLIDGNNWHAADFYAAGDVHRTFLNRLRDTIAMCDSTETVTHVGVCFDSAESFRRQIMPTYKSHRRQKPDGYFPSLDKLKATLRSDAVRDNTRILIYERHGFEADDLIAALCWRAHHEGERVLICSSDKDLHQLLKEGQVTQATKFERLNSSTVRANYLTAQGLYTKYGVKPRQWVDYRSIVGDKSDGLAGCPGCGDDVARKVLQSCITLMHFWGNPFAAPIDAGKRNKLIAFKSDYEVMSRMIQLRTDALDPVEATA